MAQSLQVSALVDIHDPQLARKTWDEMNSGRWRRVIKNIQMAVTSSRGRAGGRAVGAAVRRGRSLAPQMKRSLRFNNSAAAKVIRPTNNPTTRVASRRLLHTVYSAARISCSNPRPTLSVNVPLCFYSQ